MALDKITHNNVLLAIIIGNNFKKEGVAFFTDDNFYNYLITNLFNKNSNE